MLIHSSPANVLDCKPSQVPITKNPKHFSSHSQNNIYFLRLPLCKMYDPSVCSHKVLCNTESLLFTFSDVCLHLESGLQNSFIKSEKRVALGICQSRRGVTKLQQGFVVQGEGFVISPAS